jgi:hypothetical protein
MADWAGTRRPGSITLATTVMVVRAVIGLLGIVLVFAVKDDIRQANRTATTICPHRTPTLRRTSR